MNIDEDSTLDQAIEYNDEEVQQDLEPPVTASVNINLANGYHTDNLPTIANNILINKDHHDINYNTSTSTLISHKIDNNNNEDADTLAFPFISAIAIKLPKATHNNNGDTSNYHPYVNNRNNMNYFYDHQE